MTNRKYGEHNHEMSETFSDHPSGYPRWLVWVLKSRDGIGTTIQRCDSPEGEFYLYPIPWRFLDAYLLFVQDAIQTMTADLPLPEATK